MGLVVPLNFSRRLRATSERSGLSYNQSEVEPTWLRSSVSQAELLHCAE